MKTCCQQIIAELASTDALVELMLQATTDRDAATREARHASAAVRRVTDLHTVIITADDGTLVCAECRKPAPCDTATAVRY